MTLLIVSPTGRVGRWLDSLCDAHPSYAHTTCAGLAEALVVVQQGGLFDWVLVEGSDHARDGAAISRLRLAGCLTPIVQLGFSDPDAGELHPAPTLICIVENRSSGPHILGCHLDTSVCRGADELPQPIFEYRGSNHTSKAAVG